jgi:hypothetical protein
VDEIDRELASALSIEPSPEFRARVRARIEREPAPRAWYLQWRVVGAGVAALLVAATVGLIMSRTTVTNTASTRDPIAVVRSDHPTLRVADSTTAQPRIAVPAVRRQSPRVNRVEVLVAPEEVRALRVLADLVREGRTQFVFADEAPSPVKEIVVAPIVIEPIDAATNPEPGGLSEGDQQ